MSTIDKETQKKMEADLEKYLKSKEAKDFSECMSESNRWLEEQKR